MSDPRPIPIGILKGKYNPPGGDPSLVPDGYLLQARNVVVRPNRLESRPPFVYDSLMTIRGLANVDDTTNRVSRLVALNSTPNVFRKATSGETWSGSLGAANGSRLLDSANYKGILYMTTDDGSGTPAVITSLSGTTVDTNATGESLAARTITPYNDRLFITGVYASIFNLLGTTGSERAYDPTTWTVVNGVGENITAGSTVVGRVTPTAISGAYAQILTTGTLTTSTFSGVWRSDLRNTHNTYAMPLSLDVVETNQRANNTAYAVGQVVIPATANGFRYRCVTAGTSAGAPPAFGTTVGGTTNDGTVVWRCDGSEAYVSSPVTLPSRGTSSDFSTYWVEFSIEIVSGASPVNPPALRITFGNVNAALTTTAPVEVSLKDGYSDGDLRKANKGQQLTGGRFRYPFVNVTNAGVTGYLATRELTDDVYYSDILQPKTWRASSTYRLIDRPGATSAATTLAGRLLIFKRNAFWVFVGNTDQNSLDVIPIRRERVYNSIGCIGTKALDSFGDVLYFIGEDSVYRFTVGMDEPEDIAGDAMREEIMDRGANWVESQATYKMPLLRVNKKEKEVWVYTQKGTIHVYNIRSGAWTTLDVASNAEIADFIYNPNTRKMYVAVGGYGLARVDWSVSPANDTVDNTANTYTCTKDIVVKQELFPRVDALVEEVGVFHVASASQTSQTLTAYASVDRGATYPYSDAITLDTTTPRNPIYLYEMAPSVTVKLSHVGKAGATIYGVSKLDLQVQILSGEWPQTVPTGTATP